jgi:hypothetical protein
MTVLLLLLALTPLQDQYNAGNYERVVAQAESVLAQPRLTRPDSLETRQLYAFSLVALGRNDEATAVFKLIIAGQPDLVLDPEKVSPKIRAVFETAKEQMPARPAPAPKVHVDTVMLRQPVPISVLVPGLSQIQARKSTKGYALLGASILSLAGLGISHFSYNRAHSDYLAASEPQEISEGYQTANGWHRSRYAFAGATVAVWLLNLIDGLLRL